MNSSVKRILSLVGATAALLIAGSVRPNTALAYLVTRTTTLPIGGSPAPTVVGFDSLNGLAPLGATPLASGGPNGGVTIRRFLPNGQSVFSSVDYGGNAMDGLRIGRDDRAGLSNDGAALLRFDDPRGMGFFSFSLGAISGNTLDRAGLIFLSGSNEIQRFTFAQLLAATSSPGNVFSFAATNSSEIFDGVLFAQEGAGRFIVDDIAYQAIPTPALLPGLLALGASIVRKRQAEAEVEVEAEA